MPNPAICRQLSAGNTVVMNVTPEIMKQLCMQRRVGPLTPATLIVNDSGERIIQSQSSPINI